jgi:hypothetical protein
LLKRPPVDASFFEIPVGSGGGEREEKVVRLFNVLREADRLSGLRRTVVSLLAALGVLLAVALAVDVGRSALTLIAAMTGASLIGVLRLRQLERRLGRIIDELVLAVGARGF